MTKTKRSWQIGRTLIAVQAPVEEKGKEEGWAAQVLDSSAVPRKFRQS